MSCMWGTVLSLGRWVKRCEHPLVVGALVRLVVGALALAGIGLATQPAGAAGTTQRSGAAHEPLGVSSASLAQDGLELVWRVQLAVPFSPGGLGRDHRTLCLLIERPARGSIGQACVAGPGRRHGPPRLVYERITAAGPGPPEAIAATITRSSSSELTASFSPGQIGIGYGPLRWQVISTLSAPACSSAIPNRSSCRLLFPTSANLLALHTPRLVGCVPSGPSEVFEGRSSEREIALTFDDGPGPDPPASEFVNVLASEHVPATFFEIGDQIPQFDANGSAERAMLADGDMIGDHTWTHPIMTNLSERAQEAQLEQTAAAIRKRTGFTPCLWRPPYGDVDPRLVSLARSLGMLTIMWDVDPRDWALPGTSAIYQRVVAAAHDGAIVIQHFGGGPRYETLAALPHEIATLRAEGYTFVTVAQLLGLKLIYR
jgi:peptidoglycan-N-acetylglucosamine deacetylase